MVAHRSAALGSSFWVVSPSAAALAGQEPTERRAFLEVTLNGVSAGEALVILGVNEVWLGAATLDDFGVMAAQSEPRTDAMGAMVALSSLAPDVTYELDEEALTLRLTVHSKRLGHTTLDLATVRPPRPGVREGPERLRQLLGRQSVGSPRHLPREWRQRRPRSLYQHGIAGSGDGFCPGSIEHDIR